LWKKSELKARAPESCPSVPQTSKKRATPRQPPTQTFKKKPKVRKVHRVRTDNIQVVGKRRACDPEKFHDVAQSLAKIGLNYPITVILGWGKAKLVTGLHRLEAAKSLGWEYIDAFAWGGDETDARLWEIAENLHRVELTVLESAELTVEWEQLITAQGVQVAQLGTGGLQPHDAGISKAARDLGLSREKIRRARRIAGISPEAKAEAVAAGLGDTQSALLEIAKEDTTDGQLQKITKIVARKARQDAKHKRRESPGSDDSQPKGNSTETHPKAVLLAELKSTCAAEFRKTWAAASTEVRRRFLSEVLQWEGGKPSSEEA
jgi:ParB-like chromosome segregation protein Spo0J